MISSTSSQSILWSSNSISFDYWLTWFDQLRHIKWIFRPIVCLSTTTTTPSQMFIHVVLIPFPHQPSLCSDFCRIFYVFLIHGFFVWNSSGDRFSAHSAMEMTLWFGVKFDIVHINSIPYDIYACMSILLRPHILRPPYPYTIYSLIFDLIVILSVIFVCWWF